MTDPAFGVLAVFAVIGLTGSAGVLIAFFPSVIPRAINAYWAFFGLKSRMDVSDYEKLSVRVAGGLFIVFAIYLLINVWSHLWK